MREVSVEIALTIAKRVVEEAVRCRLSTMGGRVQRSMYKAILTRQRAERRQFGGWWDVECLIPCGQVRQRSNSLVRANKQAATSAGVMAGPQGGAV